jgi:hypothetical protein
MSELLGGTTGQVLSKTSNTNMDFTWVTPEVGDITGITATSPLTGGGTSGAVTVGILSGTTSNLGAVQLSTSTSSTSTSLAATASAVKEAYDPAFTNNFYAGKNKIINGDFGINQRAFVSGTTEAYSFDRMLTVVTNGGGTVTTSAQTFTAGTAPVTGYEGTNFFRCVTAGQSASDSRAGLAQRIENVRTFANQTITVSFWAKAASGTPNITASAQQRFGSGGSAAVWTLSTVQAISTSWARYSLNIVVPSVAGKTIVNADSALNIVIFFSAGTALSGTTAAIGVQNNTFDIWGWQVEAGSTATPFQTSTGTIQGELAACQRYYLNLARGANLALGVISYYNASSLHLGISYPVEMRAAPTLEQVAGTNYFGVFNDGATRNISGSWTLADVSTRATRIYATSDTAATGQAGFATTTNASAVLALLAEI